MGCYSLLEEEGNILFCGGGWWQTVSLSVLGFIVVLLSECLHHYNYNANRRAEIKEQEELQHEKRFTRRGQYLHYSHLAMWGWKREGELKSTL